MSAFCPFEANAKLAAMRLAQLEGYLLSGDLERSAMLLTHSLAGALGALVPAVAGESPEDLSVVLEGLVALRRELAALASTLRPGPWLAVQDGWPLDAKDLARPTLRDVTVDMAPVARLRDVLVMWANGEGLPAPALFGQLLRDLAGAITLNRARLAAA